MIDIKWKSLIPLKFLKVMDILFLLSPFSPSPVPELSFLPAPDIGAEPGRAKGESRITYPGLSFRPDWTIFHLVGGYSSQTV